MTLPAPAGTVRAVQPGDRTADTLREVLHEIRTPLAALAALAASVDGPARETYLSVLAHLSGILEHALGDAAETCGDAVDLGVVVGDAARLVGIGVDGDRFTVAGVDGIVACGDRVLLTQIMVNLLVNAARHAPEGTRVEIRGGRRGTEVFLAVRDHGPGIREEHIDRIFEPGATFGAHNGSGIGLALSRRLAERMDGTLRLVEQDETTFELVLPAG